MSIIFLGFLLQGTLLANLPFAVVAGLVLAVVVVGRGIGVWGRLVCWVVRVGTGSSFVMGV